jgi:hypothetical protein
MSKRWSVGIAAIVVAMLAIAGTTLSGSEQRGGNLTDRDRFIGAWRLVSFEEQGADGTSHKADATGQFVFSRDGHTSVQVTYQDVGTAASTKPTRPEWIRGDVWSLRGRRADEDVYASRLGRARARPRRRGPATPLRVLGQSVDRQAVQSGRTLASDVGAVLT